MKQLAIWSLALAAFFVSATVLAANPAGGTLSDQNRTLEYVTDTLTPDPPDPIAGNSCTGANCDHYSLAVFVPAGYVDQHPQGQIVINLSWLNPANDMDLYLLNSAGNEIGTSGSPGPVPESITIPLSTVPPAGQAFFTVRVQHWSGAPDTGNVTIELIPGPTVDSADDDADGVPNSRDECPDTPEGTVVNSKGCEGDDAEEIPLYFHGNLHDGCSGTGSNDFIVCNGPLLSDEDLDTNPAAQFQHNALGSTAAQGPYDSNWTWTPTEAVTVEGTTVVFFWASCGGGCIALGGEWAASLWKNGIQVAPANTDEDFIMVHTPSTPDVPERLQGSFRIESPISLNGAGDTLTLKLEHRYSDAGAGSRIYYDSQDPCVAGVDGPCDSQVIFNAKDSDLDGVPDLLDECPGTPLGTSVDSVGCPSTSACAVEASGVTTSSNSLVGPTIVDDAVLHEWSALPRDASYGAFVHFKALGTKAAQDYELKLLGLKKTHDFRRYIDVVFAEGPVWAFQRLASHPWIARVEYNAPLRYMDATQSWATRTRMAQEIISGGPYFDANGQRLTGLGVTLGAIDSGMFGAHPDFAGRIVHNFKYAVLGYADVGYADSENGAGGHGTHVQGIATGGGQQSDGGYPDDKVAPLVPGTFTSAAPDAGIMHWGHGAGIVILNGAAAYQHILDNIGTPTFAELRAVNNSYGEVDPGTPYNPNDANKQLIKRIVGCGVNMVFAAGNDGGDGSADMTSSYCKDPTPGVICVASYNDEGTGRLDGTVSGFSSRGDATKPHEYPDIAAPGDLSTSTCAQATPTQAICTGGDDSEAETEWQPWYGTISGTSMATPNVVGIIGVLAQADPSLTPGEIELLIQRTARKFGDGYVADPQNPDGTIHHAFGAGLIDTQAALDELIATGSSITRTGKRDEDEIWTVFDGDVDGDVPELAADVISLSMQNYLLNGLPGVMYRMTVADITDFLSPSLAYRVETFVRGEPRFTTIVATPDGGAVAAEPGEGNNAVASFVAIEGNTIRFFVRYSQMGFPAIDEPIHNVRVVVANASGALDYAPSPATGTIATDSVQPMYGRAFTTRLLPGAIPPSNERACELPGITAVTSPSGYAFAGGSNTGQDDLRRIWVAEPGDMPGKLVFTMKVENLNPTPLSGYRWYVYFKTPDRPEEQFIAMDTVAPGGSSAAPGFIRGVRSVTPVPGTTGVGSYTVEGTIDAESSWDPDGTITMIMDKAAFALDTGLAVTSISGSIRQTSNAENGNGLTTDSAAGDKYVLVGNALCPVRVGPLAILSADMTSGTAPLTVSFDASESTQGDAPIATYTFDFGDGSDPITQAGPTISHTFDAAGEYTVNLTVTDASEIENENPAFAIIDVARLNVAPTADAGDPFNVTEGGTGTLRGQGADADGDPVTYEWTQVLGPEVEFKNRHSAVTTFVAPLVDQDTPLAFRLTVTDELGASTTSTVAVSILDVPVLTANTRILGGGLGAGTLLILLGLAGIPRRRNRALPGQ